LREMGLSLCRLPGNHIVIAVAVSLLYAAVLTLNVSVLLQPPRLSLELSNSSPGQSHIRWILPGGYLWSHAVRLGDQILLLDGAPVRNETGSWKGTSVVVRTGDRILRLESSALEHGRTTWPLTLLSPWFFLLGTVVLLRATPPTVTRAAYAPFASAAFTRFFLLFPVPRDQERGRSFLLSRHWPPALWDWRNSSGPASTLP
jgi:hypothetical protein